MQLKKGVNLLDKFKEGAMIKSTNLMNHPSPALHKMESKSKRVQRVDPRLAKSKLLSK